MAGDEADILRRAAFNNISEESGPAHAADRRSIPDWERDWEERRARARPPTRRLFPVADDIPARSTSLDEARYPTRSRSLRLDGAMANSMPLHILFCCPQSEGLRLGAVVTCVK